MLPILYRRNSSTPIAATALRLLTTPLSPFTSRRSPRSRRASLATDHSGHAGALRTAGARSGLKWMCPRRQRFTRLGPADLGEADRDGRGCVAANGECAGRSLRAGRWKTHFVRLPTLASLLASRGAPRSPARGLPLVGHASLGRTARGAGWGHFMQERSRRRERERADGSVGRCRRKTTML